MALALGDDLVLVAEGLDRRDRAEDLLAEQPGVVGDAGEDGGGEEVAGAVGRLAAGDDRRALRHRVVDEVGDLVAGLGIDQRADRDAVLEAVAELERLHPRGELLDEGVVHRLVDVEAVGGGAGLAHVAHLGDHRALDRGIEVGVVEDDERGVAAELHHRLDDVLRGGGDQLPPDLGRAGEGDDADAQVLEHLADHRARAARGDDVDDARRHARLLEDRHQGQRGQRRLRGRLEDDGAAGGERRADLARRHRGGEVPRRDQHGDAGTACAGRRCGRRRTAPSTPGRYCAPPPRRSSGRTRRRRRPRPANPTATCRSPASSAWPAARLSRSMISCALRRISPRSRGFLAAQPGPAAAAASTAAIASSTLAEATEAIVASVAGSVTSSRAPSDAGRHVAADIEVGRDAGEEVVVGGLGHGRKSAV